MTCGRFARRLRATGLRVLKVFDEVIDSLLCGPHKTIDREGGDLLKFDQEFLFSRTHDLLGRWLGGRDIDAFADQLGTDRPHRLVDGRRDICDIDAILILLDDGCSEFGGIVNSFCHDHFSCV